uniref:hypothetical protein n=1 Tax=Flavobacterium sp. TaxID=239 RepID=UPI00404A73BD
MNFNLISKIVSIIISLVGIIFLITVFSADDREGGLIEPFIYLSYITLGISVMIVLLYTVVNLASKQGKDLKQTFIGFGAFIVILVLSYVMADGTAVTLKGGEVVTETASRLVSTGLYAFYILAALAIVLMVVSGFNRIKK